MTLTREDLSAISQLLDEKVVVRFEAIERRLDIIEERLDVIEERIDALERRIDALEKRMDALEGRMDALERRIDALEGRMDAVESDIRTLQNSVTKINLTLENMVIPRLNTIESCYIDTYRRYQKDADRMEAAFEDIELLKQVVAEHSEKLQKLA